MPPLLKRRNTLRVRRTKKLAHLMSSPSRININPSNFAQSIVPTFLSMVNTVKLFHWRTDCFAAHKATDDLFSHLNKKVDDFVEVLLGKPLPAGSTSTSRAMYLSMAMPLQVPFIIDTPVFTARLEMYKEYLMSMGGYFDAVKDSDLLAIRDEILALFNQYLYLQSLN